jgi:ABC-type antimicrobial peptide transport system permease subunit
MNAVLVRARAELRARLGSVLALALLVGLASGAVLTSAAGARRTDSSYTRFAMEHKAADMEVYPAFGPTFAQLDFDELERLPQVVAAERLHSFGANESDQVVSAEPRLGTMIDVPKLLEGRMPSSDSLDEAAVSFTAAKTAHLHVGSRLTLEFAKDFASKRFPVTFRVVGVEASPGEFPPLLSNTPGSSNLILHVGDAFYRSMKDRAFNLDFLFLRFRHGVADAPAVVAELNHRAKGKPQLNVLLADQAANVQRSIHLQAIALWIVGGIVALISVLIISQLLARQALLDAVETSTLAALGMTRMQMCLTGMGRSFVIGLGGAALGVSLALASSPLMPIGTARIAEPHPGASFDSLVVGIGAVVTVFSVLALAAWPVWKNTRVAALDDPSERGSAKPSLIARTAARPGFSPSVGTGMRLALEPGKGRTEVPVRSSLVSVTLAVAALAIAFTFGACLNHLLATPRTYGWNWDAHITTNTDADIVPAALKKLQADTRVEAAAWLDTPPLTLGRQRFDSVGLQQVKGLITPILIDGRRPVGPDEVALGAKSLRDAHAHIGSTVRLSIAAIEGPSVPMRVVGVVVLPPNSDSARLGVGAVMSYEAEKSMIPPQVRPPPTSDIYMRLAPGVNKAAVLKDIRRSLGSDYSMSLPSRPTDLVNFGQVQNLPLLLAGLVALLAAATLAHTLVTAIRRRRRDLAILKMLGFVPRQVRSAVAWQATTFVSVALLIGLPVGTAVGRVLWRVFANQLGALAEPVTPSVPLLVTIPAAILLANLIAAAPAVIAGRMKPAVVLRAE